MNDVTQILEQMDGGDPTAADRLLPLVYAELRRLARSKMAHESPSHTLQATALVHEAYLRLVGGSQQWESRRHFFAAAAEAMRRILVESARSKNRIKRGGDRQQRPLLEGDLTLQPPPDDLLALDEAFSELQAANPDIAEVVKLRFFAGLTVEETAEALGVSDRTIKRHWTYGRAWLRRAMGSE